ncbi:cysteine hydrolase family protein [Bacteroidota bacterium]
MKTVLLSIVSVLFLISTINAQKKEKETNEVKPVLIVMDIQNQYIPSMDKEETDLGLQYINAYIELFRKHDLPVITVYHQDKERGPHQDSLDFQFPESVNILPDDPKIIKNYPSAFTKTDLHKIIDENGGNTLFICGLSATGCVLATYLASYDYDYNAFLIKNGIISRNSTHTDQIEEIFGAVNYRIVKVLVESIQ